MKETPFKTLIPLLLAALIAFIFSGCEPPEIQKDPNWNSGPDGTRLGATEVPVNRTIIDHVDRRTGDMTDWKYFSVPVSSIIEFAVGFDDAQAKGNVIIRDETGTQITRVEHLGEPRLQTTFRADPGIFYVEVYAMAGGSSYTFEVNVTQ